MIGSAKVSRLMANTEQAPLYSIVAPVYGERDNLQPLYDRLKRVMDGLAMGQWELILVDDGSRDDSWPEIMRLHAFDSQVKGIKFSRNFGQHIALTAGLDAARGRRVVTMDSDLQDKPEEIPKLAKKMDEGYDLVYASRLDRKHSLGKRLTSGIFLGLLNAVSDVAYPITGAVFRMMDRPFVDHFCKLRERHRLFTGLTAWMGFRQAGVEVVHEERHSGETKYSLSKMLRLSADSIAAFSSKPLYLAIYIGGGMSALSIALSAWVVVRHYTVGFAVVGWASLMAAVCLLGGLNLTVLGIIGQYLGRMYEEQKGRPLYIVEKATS